MESGILSRTEFFEPVPEESFLKLKTYLSTPSIVLIN
jgi:hypothetical protein